MVRPKSYRLKNKRILVLLVLLVLGVAFGLNFQPREAVVPNRNASDNLRKESRKQIDSVQSYTYEVFETIPKEIASKILGVSFLPEGPVKLDELAYIKLAYWGFDRKTHLGEIIVHKQLAKEVVDIFGEIYAAKFPIAKMRLIDEYQASDDLSMAANNTSGLCMRKVRGSNRYSKHSLGVAIDINPVQNPYLYKGLVLPQGGQEYANRQNLREGMIVSGGVVYEAFKKRGWIWGGEWRTLKDYQHFEKNLNFSTSTN